MGSKVIQRVRPKGNRVSKELLWFNKMPKRSANLKESDKNTRLSLTLLVVPTKGPIIGGKKWKIISLLSASHQKIVKTVISGRLPMLWTYTSIMTPRTKSCFPLQKTRSKQKEKSMQMTMMTQEYWKFKRISKWKLFQANQSKKKVQSIRQYGKKRRKKSKNLQYKARLSGR